MPLVRDDRTQSVCRRLLWHATVHQPAVEEAIVTDRREETERLARDMPAQDITVTQDETFTGGLCLVAIEPVSNYILLEQPAEGRDQDTWSTLMTLALAPLKCNVIQSTSDEAPGLLAYVEHHLGAHHSPDLFHVHHELNKAVSAPMAAKQRAAHKAVVQAEETLKRVQAHPQSAARHRTSAAPAVRQRRPVPGAGRAGRGSCAPRAPAPADMREQMAQSMRAIGHAYHFVDLAHGVRRNGKLIASDIQHQIDTIRASPIRKA